MSSRPDDWPRVREVFEAAVALAAVARPAYLSRTCGEDDALRRQVEALLASHERAKSFLETPAVPPLTESITTSLVAGQRIGAYELAGRIGAGGMGEVYRARDTRLGRDVAIKVLPAHLARNADACERFEREAHAVAALNHPHIVTIFSTEEADGVRFLTMELVEGRTLDQLIPRGGVSVTVFFDIASALADALAAAHRKHVTHRDLKPANVMVSDEGRVKVLDFGLARSAEPESGRGDADATRAPLTAEGTILGTMPYMSPEQIEALPLDPRTDIFSLGIVLYEMATGDRPFGGASSPALMSAILKDRPTPVSERRSDFPGDVSRLIDRCLEKRPRDRIQTATEILAELKSQRRAWESRAGASAKEASDQRPTATSASDFRIGVLPFVCRIDDPDAGALADGLTEEITAGLARFPHLRVVSRPDAERLKGQPSDAASAAATLGARYLLEGHVRTGGPSVRVTVRLVDSQIGGHMWAETYDRALSGARLFEVQDDIARRVVATVADSSGVLVRSMGAPLKNRACDALSVAELVLRYYVYTAQVKADEHVLLRSAFERALEREPLQANGWACLAGLYHQEHGLGLNPLPDTARRLRQAAERAIELDPACQDGWKELAISRFFFDRDLTGLRMAADRAVSLNPLDTGVVAWVGIMLAYAGDWERGVEIAQQAMAPNPHHPGWYHLAPAVYHYTLREYDEALKSAKRINMPAFFASHLNLAAAAGQLGRHDDAQTALQNLEAIGSAFLDPVRARRYWTAWIWDEQIVEHLVEGFVKAKALVDRKTPATGQTASIAVLPFANMSADKDNEYFGDGLAEEIINVLAQVPGLKVTGRTSSFFFRGKDVEFEEIGRRLNVDHILEGSVRKAGNRIRVTAQLIKVADGFHLWSERYDREMTDIFAIQDEMTQAIAAALRIKLSPDSTKLQRHVPNLRAYQAYLKARDYWYKPAPESLELFKQLLDHAIELDPKFGLAYSLLGGYYTMQAGLGIRAAREVMPLARAAEQEALRVEPSLPEAHGLLGVCAGTYDYDWNEAERHWRLAMAREPVSRDVRFWYGNHYLLPIGRPVEAVEAMGRSLEEDPVNPMWRHHFAVGLRHLGRLDDAEAELRKVLEIDENYPLALGTLGAVCAQQERFGEALTVTEHAYAVTPWSNQIIGQLAAILVRTGDTGRADSLIEKLGSGTAYGAPTGLALFHALCGDIDRAAEWAERAIEERYPPLVAILGPFLRSCPRWPALAKLMNLPG